MKVPFDSGFKRLLGTFTQNGTSSAGASSTNTA